MKKSLKISLASLAATGLVLGLFGSLASAANTATFYLTPASGSYTTGGSVSVQVWEDSSSDVVNAGEIDLTYPTANLTFQSITHAAVWDIVPVASGGSGTVTMDFAHCQEDPVTHLCTNPLSGPQLVATVNFTAAAAGSAPVNFASGTVLYRASDNGAETLTKTNATYTISAPVAPPSGGSGSGGGSTSGGSGSTSGSTSTSKSSPSSSTSKSTSSSPSSQAATPAQSAAAQPSLSDVQIKNLSDSTATITWHTSVPATSEVDYGPTASYGFTVTDSTLTTDHSLVLDPSYLQANKDYHYQIKSVDASGKLITSQDASFKTQVTSGTPAKKSGDGLWETLAALLIVGAAAAVTLSLHRHLHNMTPAPVAAAAGGPHNHHITGGIITPSGHPAAPAAASHTPDTPAAPKKINVIMPTSGSGPAGADHAAPDSAGSFKPVEPPKEDPK